MHGLGPLPRRAVRSVFGPQPAPGDVTAMARTDRQNPPTAMRMSGTRGGQRKGLIMFRSIATVLAATAVTGFLSTGIASAAPDRPQAPAAVTQHAQGGDGGGGGVGVGGVGDGSRDHGVGVGGVGARGTVGVGGVGSNGNEGVGVGGL